MTFNSFAFKLLACIALMAGIFVATYAGCDVLIGDTEIDRGQYRDLSKRLAVDGVSRTELRLVMADGRITHRELNSLTLNGTNNDTIETERARIIAAL